VVAVAPQVPVTCRGQHGSSAHPLTHACPACLCQDDLLYETLTVNETLMYAARLRLPNNTSYAEKAARVATVVAALGLVKCQDTIIGGFFRRGISGG
jgi:ABC-type multidrug transport system ATPase subunit